MSEAVELVVDQGDIEVRIRAGQSPEEALADIRRSAREAEERKAAEEQAAYEQALAEFVGPVLHPGFLGRPSGYAAIAMAVADSVPAEPPAPPEPKPPLHAGFLRRRPA